MMTSAGHSFDRRRGFTLVEAVVSLLIVSTLFAAAMQAAATATRIQAVAARQSQAAALASSLLSEILQAGYSQPGSTTLGRDSGETSSSMANFNDVDDYDGWIESPPQDRDGVALPGAAGYTRTVAVVWVTLADPRVVSATDSGLKRITVTVAGPGVSLQMAGYRANVD